MEKEQIRSISQFFFYAFSDERLAARGCLRAIKQLRVGRSSSAKTLISQEQLVRVTYDVWKYFLKVKFVATESEMTEEHWDIPRNLDLGPWKQFRKQSNPNELLAVLYLRILGFEDSEVARGLGLTLGTVQYRLGNGLKMLGTMTPLGGL